MNLLVITLSLGQLDYTIDTQNISQKYSDTVKARIKSVTKVPVENIFISAIHTHSSLYPDTNAAWATAVFLPRMADAAKEAIADLTDSTAYLGEGKSTGMAFVRRWICEDGTPVGIWRLPNSSPKVSYESEADNSVQCIYSARYSNESTAYNTVVKNQTPQTPSPESLDADTVSLTHRVSGE